MDAVAVCFLFAGVVVVVILGVGVDMVMAGEWGVVVGLVGSTLVDGDSLNFDFEIVIPRSSAREASTAGVEAHNSKGKVGAVHGGATKGIEGAVFGSTAKLKDGVFFESIDFNISIHLKFLKYNITWVYNIL